jgi:ABC-type glycerol-3-phosphate transport system substrate-binding protein
MQKIKHVLLALLILIGGLLCSCRAEEPFAASGESQKTEITMGSIGFINEFVQAATADFNSENDDVKIVLKRYRDNT